MRFLRWLLAHIVFFRIPEGRGIGLRFRLGRYKDKNSGTGFALSENRKFISQKEIKNAVPEERAKAR